MPGTEAIDPRYAEIDNWPTIDAVTAMIEGQREAIEALNSQADAIAAACAAAAQRLLSSQGRLIYVGAGTSGRVAVQDGVELTPTFGRSEEHTSELQSLMRILYAVFFLNQKNQTNILTHPSTLQLPNTH